MIKQAINALIALLVIASRLSAEEVQETPPAKDTQQETPLKVGNLSLPASQQPGPLLSFGGNIIDKGALQLYITPSQFHIHRGYYLDVVPSVLYAISDVASVYVNLPIAAAYREGCHRSSGLGDAFVQFEYAYYSTEGRCASDTATIVGNVTFPTGSARRNPATGLGAPAFLIGTTYNHTGVDWFGFTSLGALLTTFHGDSKSADEFLYEVGFGRNIAAPPGWIFAWLVEIDGAFSYRHIDHGVADMDSGGNVIFITPSLWISSEKLIIQLGAGGVLTQHFFGDQDRYTYQLVGSLGWTF